jgi:hypothetical protein
MQLTHHRWHGAVFTVRARALFFLPTCKIRAPVGVLGDVHYEHHLPHASGRVGLYERPSPVLRLLLRFDCKFVGLARSAGALAAANPVGSLVHLRVARSIRVVARRTGAIWAHVLRTQ